ncbi:MAG: glycosyltransferase family 25 protein [Akkermansia sp.]|nr:glycosyltransferase family 25 protein [Akkermansia sp.]
MNTSPDIRYYYINLDRATDRRASAEKQAADFGIELERIEAVAGKDLDIDSIAAYDRKRRLSEFAAELTANEHACIMSHLKALQAFVDSGAKYGIIMEDDFVLHPQFNEGITWLTEKTSGWQALKLFTEDGSKLYPLHAPIKDCPWEIVFPKKLPWVAVGNIYTQEGAKRVLKGFERYWMGYDVQWAWITLGQDIPCCGITPTLVNTSDPKNENSTIDAEDSRVAYFEKHRREQTLKNYIVHRLSVWIMAWGKLRMRARMKSLLKFH